VSLAIARHVFPGPGYEQCFAIRLAVFVEEQKIPFEEEIDSLDGEGEHFLALIGGVPAGTARLLLKENGTVGKVTRVAVLAKFRGQGICSALLRYIEAVSGIRRFMLDAQEQAMPFYASLGYVAEGTMFLDAGIPHRRMVKSLAATAA
jgi:predicted GNAT family N-acyltransferase